MLLPKVGFQVHKLSSLVHADIFLDIYNDEFFAGIDGVTNALDNVAARKPSSAIIVVDDLTSSRAIYGQEVYHLREASAGIRDPRNEGQYASRASVHHGVLLFISGSSRETSTVMYSQEFPQRHRSHNRGMSHPRSV